MKLKAVLLAVLSGASSLTGALAQSADIDREMDSLWGRPALFDGPGSPKEALRDRGISLVSG